MLESASKLLNTVKSRRQLVLRRMPYCQHPTRLEPSHVGLTDSILRYFDVVTRLTHPKLIPDWFEDHATPTCDSLIAIFTSRQSGDDDYKRKSICDLLISLQLQADVLDSFNISDIPLIKVDSPTEELIDIMLSIRNSLPEDPPSDKFFQFVKWIVCKNNTENLNQFSIG